MIKKITVKGEFSNRTYLYEVEDGIDFFNAVRKASAEFVNTPNGRKIYYKKGSFSWLDFSLLFKNRKHKIFCHFREKYRNTHKIKCYDKGFKTVGLSASLPFIKL